MLFLLFEQILAIDFFPFNFLKRAEHGHNVFFDPQVQNFLEEYGDFLSIFYYFFANFLFGPVDKYECTMYNTC